MLSLCSLRLNPKMAFQPWWDTCDLQNCKGGPRPEVDPSRTRLRPQPRKPSVAAVCKLQFDTSTSRSHCLYDRFVGIAHVWRVW